MSRHHQPKLPDSVIVHPRGEPAPIPPRIDMRPRDPKAPPPGWLGSYNTCGACGDFLDGLSCPACMPAPHMDASR